MIDKIKVVAFCHQPSKSHQSPENPLMGTLCKMPQYIADELGGTCQYCSFNLFKAWSVVLFHASDIHVLVIDDTRKPYHGLCKWHHWLNPSGIVVRLSKLKALLFQEPQYSADWTEANYRLWVNRALLPQIGFKPLAEIWENL